MRYWQNIINMYIFACFLISRTSSLSADQSGMSDNCNTSYPFISDALGFWSNQLLVSLVKSKLRVHEQKLNLQIMLLSWISAVSRGQH